mmetsp:Transcript_46856/g.111134  ORF Transcript_46856/g.111134 Transcript_46856/m.111134 type:complete len:233 (-) Transcript_46856:1041-1739(-)
MPDLPPADSSDPPHLAVATRREGVLQVEPFRVLAIECVHPLPAPLVAKRHRRECLRVAASEEGRAVDGGRRERVHVDADGTHGLGSAAIDAQVLILGEQAHFLGREALERGFDVDFAASVARLVEEKLLRFPLHVENRPVHVELPGLPSAHGLVHGIAELVLELGVERGVRRAHQRRQRLDAPRLLHLVSKGAEALANGSHSLHACLDRLRHLLLCQEVCSPFDHHHALLRP